MMLGKAATNGAATVVNAIASGRGSAFGIALEADASLRLQPGEGEITVDGAADGGGLVSGCVRSAAEASGLGAVSGHAEVRSEIPISRGLKSSSAVSNVVVLAAARAIGAELDDGSVLNLAIDQSIRAGVTVTGAFDDAAACYHGGLVMTDNTSRKIVKTGRLDPSLEVVLHVPYDRILKGNIDKSRFTDLRDMFDEAFDLALRGAYQKAMELNSKATAEALGLSEEAAEAARQAGAYAAGITGTGPASVALCRRDREADVERAFSRFEGDVIRTTLNTTPSREVVPRLL